MPNALRGLLAVLAGLVVGGCANMALVSVGPMLIPPPPGVDMTDMEGLRSGMALFQPRHFLFPFLAHAFGSLLGGLVAALLMRSYAFTVGMVVGGVFLVGGIAASSMLPAPAWFIATDLLLAYLPMAGLGVLIAKRLSRSAAQ